MIVISVIAKLNGFRKPLALVRFWETLRVNTSNLDTSRKNLGKQNLDMIPLSSTFPSSDFIWGGKTSIWLMFQGLFPHQILFGETKTRFDWCFKYFSPKRFYLGRQKVDLIDVSSTFPSSDFIWGDKTFLKYFSDIRFSLRR